MRPVGDISEIQDWMRSIEREDGVDGKSFARLLGLRSPRTVIMVAVENGDVLGAALGENDGAVDGVDVYVEPTARRIGIGTVLAERVIAKLEESGNTSGVRVGRGPVAKAFRQHVAARAGGVKKEPQGIADIPD